MNQTHVAFVAAVDAKHIERANGQSFDLWQVHDSLGNIWVVKKPLADFARTLVGQQAQFTTRNEQKGNFLNFYADAIYPLNAQGLAIQPDQSGVTQQQAVAMNAGYDPYSPQQVPVPYVPQGMPVPGAPQPGAGVPVQDGAVSGSAQHDRERNLSINRSVAVKAAAKVCMGDQYVFWTMLNDIMGFLEVGALPANIQQAVNFAEQAIAAPQAHAEGASLPTPDPYGDEIPFEQ